MSRVLADITMECRLRSTFWVERRPNPLWLWLIDHNNSIDMSLHLRMSVNDLARLRVRSCRQYMKCLLWHLMSALQSTRFSLVIPKPIWLWIYGYFFGFALRWPQLHIESFRETNISVHKDFVFPNGFSRLHSLSSYRGIR